MRALAGWLPLMFAVALCVLPQSAGAESSLLLPFPPELGPVPATTFDAVGREIGRSEFSLEAIDEDHFELLVTMRIDGGAHTRVRAVFEAVPDGANAEPRLRMLTERSQSFEVDGTPMTLLEIDHVAGTASCTPPADSADVPSTLSLPTDDRVANTPMHLLFLPIIRGEVERIRFQLFVCRGGATLHDFVALAGGPPVTRDGRTIQEIRYGPDLGRWVSWVASRVLPKLSFWFDTSHRGEYVAHRMPLYSKGPEILMIRSGVEFPALGSAF